MDIDPRGARFGAAITTVVLAAVLITGSAWLLAAQAVVFGIGAFLGLKYAPYGLIYRALVRPRLGPPKEMEDEAPPLCPARSGRWLSHWWRLFSTRPSACALAAKCT